MTLNTDDSAELIPIDAAARLFGIRASTLRYYDQRNLVTPASRHSGRRWYGPDQVRRIGAIRFWQQNGRLGLEEIATILDDTPSRSGPDVLRDQLHNIVHQIQDLQQAKAALEHILEHHPDSGPDGCPHYEALIAPMTAT